MDTQTLHKFLSKTDIRDYCRKPIRRSDGIYATNGEIFVCIPDSHEIEAIQVEKPDFQHFYADYLTRQFKPLDVQLTTGTIECKHCKDGKVITCPDCDGMGEFEHGDHTYDCKECDSGGYLTPGKNQLGDTTCRNCDGLGCDPHQTTDVHGTHFANKYIRLMQELPSIEISVNEHFEMGVAFFRFEGGWGGLMPCSPKNIHSIY